MITAKIYHDDLAEEPEDEPIKLALFSGRHNLPNTDGISLDQAGDIYANAQDFIALMVYAYDHSGLYLATDIQPTWWHYSWADGRAGIVYVSKRDVRERWGYARITAERREYILEQLRNLVEAWDSYINGDSWIACIFGDGRQIDTIAGYGLHNLKDTLEAEYGLTEDKIEVYYPADDYDIDYEDDYEDD